MSIDYQQLAAAIVDEMERRGHVGGSTADLVPLQELADELDCSRQTVYRRLDRHGIPVRDANGQIKRGGGLSYVSRAEWAEKRQIDTRAVRALA